MLNYNRNDLIKRGKILISDKYEDICDGYSFQFLYNVEQPVVQLEAVGVESRYSEEYYWDNTYSFYVITISGGSEKEDVIL